MGAPSHNFGDLPEYAYSGAILTVDLNAIGNTTYDLPTLVDDNLPTLVGPFGGDFGRHQAKITPGEPGAGVRAGLPQSVLARARTPAGQAVRGRQRLERGLGRRPRRRGPGRHVHQRDRTSPASTLNDSLHHITGPGYYGGHPNPTRGNMREHVQHHQSAVARPDGQPGRVRRSGRPAPTVRSPAPPPPTTGIAEYTATNFADQIERRPLVTTATTATSTARSSAPRAPRRDHQTAVLQRRPAHPLDVTRRATASAFPARSGSPTSPTGSINVFEPTDFGGRTATSCTGAYSTDLDEDDDGYTNADEIDNGHRPVLGRRRAARLEPQLRLRPERPERRQRRGSPTCPTRSPIDAGQRPEHPRPDLVLVEERGDRRTRARPRRSRAAAPADCSGSASPAS